MNPRVQEVNTMAEVHLRTNYLIHLSIHNNLCRDLHNAVREILIVSASRGTVWGETQKGILLAADDTFDSIMTALEEFITAKMKVMGCPYQK
jgi:hypothetical protein